MTNAELIKQLRGCKYIEFCSDCPRMPNGIIEPCDIKDAAADALEAAEQRIARLEEEHNKTVTAIFGEEQLWWENRCKELEAQIPKEAHWVAVNNGHGVCSNCNRQDSIDNMATHCRYCGARMLKTIREQPTVDAVQVVRCRDCRYYAEEYGSCGRTDIIRSDMRIIMPYWYCADGERKETDKGDK